MDWKRGPPVLVGETVLWLGSSRNKSETGVIKWIGNIPEISSDWCVGIEFDTALPNLGCDGYWKNRKLFECRSGHGLIVPMEEIQKTSPKARPVSSENYSDFVLDDTQIRDFISSDFRHKENKKTELRKNRHSYSEPKQIEDSFNNRIHKTSLNAKREARNSILEVLNDINEETFRLESSNVKGVQPVKSSRRNSLKKANALDIKLKINEKPEKSQSFNSKPYINELTKSMNEIAGYFKEIKEGDERFEKQQPDNIVLYDSNATSHSKPKRLFSFLKWFNKKHKNEPNIKLFKESSAASSPVFPRRETSSCESIDTLFSTQTVRSFAYIPPTQYMPSAPPLDFDKSSYENIFEDLTSQKNTSEETESIYDRRKKRKAPEPPRLSRENSLPTTLEHKKNEENLDGIKTYHRRTVSESFKDKKAGAYCHVQGKRKAPQPPVTQLYPNIQKMNNQYPSLYKKKKPAPPPPEFDSENRNPNTGYQSRKDVQKEKETRQPSDEPKKNLKDNESVKKEEKGLKIDQMSKDRLTKDVSLSPLPSRPWYKRSHRDSTGSNIIRKDLLKGFDKKKNKETDDWMPEVGFPRRSLSAESSHNKFNIFSKLEKNEDKKKEEKRKSQISILTNISELDREAAEIVRKEQAEEKKLIAANDAKYYRSVDSDDKNQKIQTNVTENLKSNNKTSTDINKPEPGKRESESKGKKEINQAQSVLQSISSDELKERKAKDESEEKKLKDKENDLNPNLQSNENTKQNSFSPKVLGNFINSSNSSTGSEISRPNQSPSQARLNYFNVQNKQLNYLNEPWVCGKCTLENPGWRIFCEICATVKPTFSFNSPTQKVESQAEKETKKPEPDSAKTEEQKELYIVPDKSNQNVIQESRADEKEENKSVNSEETLEELRKKRMNFFISKLQSLSESDKDEPKSPQDDSDKKDLKKILKEMKDCFTKDNPDEENIRKINEKPEEGNNKGQIKQESQEENLKNNAVPKENATVDRVVAEQKEDKMEKPKQLEDSKILRDNSQLSRNSKWEAAQNGQTQTEDGSKVVEAYIVTKTVVLEDIIVKKPERNRKVSASVQTKSSLSSSPGAKVLRPPRTKKISFENNNNKQIESQSHSEDDLKKEEKNFREEDLEELSNRLTQAEGLADFRANIESMPLNTEMNTVAVNRLLRKLEMAINCGDHFVAAGLAKELALMKINCSVTRQAASSPSTSKITIDLYIEDKISHQGPIPLKVSPTMSLLQLKQKVQQEFGIPLEVQRWILNKKLANDDSRTLEAEGIRSDKCPLFLYLVVPDNRKTNNEALKKPEKNSERKQCQDIKSTKEISNPKNQGWYYNYEEDHYSYCEDSEDESNNTDSNNKAKETNATKTSGDDQKKTEMEQEVKKVEKAPVFDLKSREAENSAERELKFISANSVKQKVEKLNKTFAQNAGAVQPPLRPSRSLETWKCDSCNIMNLPGRLNCLSCNAKKPFNGPRNMKTDNEKGPFQAKPIKKDPIKAAEKPDDNIHYKALIELQDADLVPNSEPFNCSICMTDYALGEGVTLKDCLHTFCRTCLVSTVQYSEDAEVKCPYLDETYSCPSVLQEREIKALVPQKIYELHLAKSVKEAENKIENAFHCKTPDCKGWCIYEDNVNEFRCPVCRSINCLTCQAIHVGINCREYQERMRNASETDLDAKKTRDMLNEMVEKGEAMACPKCQVVLMKKWGCDWLKCSMCKTEICWVTRGFRWGPEGKGDTSGGCKCGVNGIKCHPKCNYCH